MKRQLFRSLLLLIPITLLSFGCSEEPLPPPTAKSPASSVSTLPLKMGWPPPADKGATAVVIAENLLARNFYIVFDASGSMNEKACKGGGSKIDVAKPASVEFVQAVRDGDNVGLFVFDGNSASERVPLGTGRQHKDRLIKTIRELHAGNGTPLHDAVTRGYKKLIEQGHRQLGYGEYTLAVITDGEANSGQDPRQIVDHISDFSPVRIRTIGFCIGEKHSLNRPGRTIYTEANDLESLRRGLKQVLAEAPAFDLQQFR